MSGDNSPTGKDPITDDARHEQDKHIKCQDAPIGKGITAKIPIGKFSKEVHDKILYDDQILFDSRENGLDGALDISVGDHRT